MSEKRFVLCKKGDVEYIEDNGCIQLYGFDVLCEMLNEQQEQLDLYKEAILTMLGLLADKGIIFSGVKDE